MLSPLWKAWLLVSWKALKVCTWEQFTYLFGCQTLKFSFPLGVNPRAARCNFQPKLTVVINLNAADLRSSSGPRLLSEWVYHAMDSGRSSPRTPRSPGPERTTSIPTMLRRNREAAAILRTEAGFVSRVLRAGLWAPRVSVLSLSQGFVSLWEQILSGGKGQCRAVVEGE